MKNKQTNMGAWGNIDFWVNYPNLYPNSMTSQFFFFFQVNNMNKKPEAKFLGALIAV